MWAFSLIGLFANRNDLKDWLIARQLLVEVEKDQDTRSGERKLIAGTRN